MRNHCSVYLLILSSETRIRIQRDPERLEQCIDSKKLEFHRENHKILHSNLIHQPQNGWGHHGFGVLMAYQGWEVASNCPASGAFKFLSTRLVLVGVEEI